MFTLRADNRTLTENAKYSYLSGNHTSGLGYLDVINSSDFANDDYLLISNFGLESSEIVQIDSINTTTHRLTLKAAIKFAHSESTRIMIIKYNQIQFYYKLTDDSSTAATLGALQDIEADSYFTKYYDSTNSTGYGWFKFYNATTTGYSSFSNNIPYAGFSENSVKKILDNFYSSLNNKELKLINDDDAFSWLNESYSIALNELNLVNSEYTVQDEEDISVVSGTKEYSLPSDFSDVVSVYNDDDDCEIPFISLTDVPVHDNENTGNALRYYLRGSYIGFSPTPTDSFTVKLRYKAKSGVLTSYSDTVDLPDNNFYYLKDYMLFRAAFKLGRSDGEQSRRNFQDGINRMKITSIKRDSNADVWSIDKAANI
jgi:hypothetical protein